MCFIMFSVSAYSVFYLFVLSEIEKWRCSERSVPGDTCFFVLKDVGQYV